MPAHNLDLSLDGPVVTISIRVGQLELLAKAARRVLDLDEDTFPRTEEEAEELEVLADLVDDVKTNPMDHSGVYGFAL